MTSAARPTFDPAKGKDTKNPTQQTASRDQTSHTKLKYRKEGQDKDHNLDEDEFKEKLLNKELDYYRNKVHPKGYVEPKNKEKGQGLTHEQALLLELAESETNSQLLQTGQDDDDDEDKEGEEDDGEAKATIGLEDEDDEEDDEDDDDEEDTELLMLELEKIKKERAELKAKQEREAAEKAKEKEQETLTGNPLLNTINEQGFNIKRRWDDDVIFKNQARGVDEKPTKRFINDMLRSDFHRKFMDKYMQ